MSIDVIDMSALDEWLTAVYRMFQNRCELVHVKM
jgi:hypothetical protein